jgi:hypothetical protein
MLALVRAACSDGGCQVVRELTVQLDLVLGVELRQEPGLAFYSFAGGCHRALFTLSGWFSPALPRLANGHILPLSEGGFCAIEQYVLHSTKRG